MAIIAVLAVWSWVWSENAVSLPQDSNCVISHKTFRADFNFDFWLPNDTYLVWGINTVCDRYQDPVFPPDSQLEPNP